MIAFEQSDEVAAKCFAANNVNFKTSFERNLLKAANSGGDMVDAVWNFLMNRPSVNFEEYQGLGREKLSMDSYSDIIFNPDGTAYHPYLIIIGRKPK